MRRRAMQSGSLCDTEIAAATPPAPPPRGIPTLTAPPPPPPPPPPPRPQILVLLIFFQTTIPNAPIQVMGFLLAIIGLTMFLVSRQ